jgi:hypothetical protein
MGRLQLLLVGAAVVCVSCNRRPPGPMIYDSASIERGNIESAKINLDMDGGELHVDSNTDKLLTAQFGFNVADWKPVVEYSSTGGKGDLTLTQPLTVKPSFGANQKNEWTLHLSPDVPLDLNAKIRAGDVHMNLGSLMLRSLNVDLVAGAMDLDLRGSPKVSYNAKLSGGVGDITVHLPSDAGVDATASGDIGEVNVSGLERNGDHYVNDALGKSKVTIRVDVHGGAGSVNLLVGK